jgi:hypothetical protein
MWITSMTVTEVTAGNNDRISVSSLYEKGKPNFGGPLFVIFSK